MRRVVLVSVAAALVVGPAAGDAASAKRGKACPDGAVCLWTKKNFRGDREVVDKKGLTRLSSELNNEASSVKNLTGKTVYLMNAKNGNLGSGYRCVFDFEPKVSDLGEDDFDNRASSVLRPRPGDPRPIC